MQAFNQREIQNLRNEQALFFSAAASNRFPESKQAIDSELEYLLEPFDIVPEIEAAVVYFVEMAEQKSINMQLYLSPACLMVKIDRLYFRQICYRMLQEMISLNHKGAIIRIYVTNCDGKCVVEIVGSKETRISEDYFKKYRITNTRPVTPDESNFITYKKIMEDMNGELAYAFGNGGYVRMKFTLIAVSV